MGYGNPAEGWEGYDKMKPAPGVPPMLPAGELKTVSVTPHYQATGVEHGVVIPALQSLFVGFMLAMVLTAFLWMAHKPLETIIQWFVIVLFGGAAVSWFAVHYQDALWLIERLTQRDITMDGQIGQPVPPPAPIPTVRVELSSNKGANVDYIDLPYADRLPLLARGLAGGQPFTFSVWAGKDKPFSQGEWGKLTGELLTRKLIEYKNPKAPNLGYEPTAAGKAVFRYFAGIGRGNDLALSSEENAASAVVFASETSIHPYPRRIRG